MKKTFQLGLILASSVLCLTVPSCNSSDDDQENPYANGVRFMEKGYGFAQFQLSASNASFRVNCYNYASSTGTVQASEDYITFTPDGSNKKVKAKIDRGQWTQPYLSPTSLHLIFEIQTDMGLVTISDLSISLDMYLLQENINSLFGSPRHAGVITGGTLTLTKQDGTTLTTTLATGEGNNININYSK